MCVNKVTTGNTGCEIEGPNYFTVDTNGVSSSASPSAALTHEMGCFTFATSKSSIRSKPGASTLVVPFAKILNLQVLVF